jgi:5,10-methylenetetrahydrofolate reductase
MATNVKEGKFMSLKKRLSSGEFVIMAEMNTPKGVDTSQFVANARRIKGLVDTIIVPDMDNGIMRMSALAGGALIQQQGIEAVIHVYCRDRNRLALQGDLLAAHGLGIQNLVISSSEDIINGDHHNAKAVDDLDELGLLGAIGQLERGFDIAGNELNGSPSFMTGCCIGQFLDDRGLEVEMETAEKKVKAGACFVITPPVFDLDSFSLFADKAKLLGIPIIPTVFLIKSVGVARYIATNEPGSGMSEDIIRRIRKAPDREQECIKIAGETITALREMSQGVRIVTLGWEYRIPAILDCAGV